MKKKNIGSSFDEFLKEEGIYESVTEEAKQRVLDDKYTITIKGKDWESCYLQDSPEIMRQVTDDLQEEIKKRWFDIVIGMCIDIDVVSHSIAMEMFNVTYIDYYKKIIELEYAGGVS